MIGVLSQGEYSFRGNCLQKGSYFMRELMRNQVEHQVHPYGSTFTAAKLLPVVPNCSRIAAKLLTHLSRPMRNIQAHIYATSISPPAAQQIISSIKVILGEDGSSRGAQKLAHIRENSNFFRSELQKMGFEVLGDNDSPVMPIMLYNPVKIAAFSRECLKRHVAVGTVAFPATTLLLGRAQICISAAHSRDDLIKALEVISEVGDLVGIKYFPAKPNKEQLEENRVKLE